CFSCHRGAHTPSADPAVKINDGPASPRANAAPTGLPEALPSVSQILDAYVAALGGRAAIEEVTSRIEEGTITTDGTSVPIEIISGEAGKQAIIRHLANGDS